MGSRSIIGIVLRRERRSARRKTFSYAT